MASLSLEITSPDVPAQTVRVAPGATSLGRSTDSLVYLNHVNVSRRHAEIRCDEAGARIADLGSANGTRLNRIELEPKEWQTLQPGDVVNIDPFELRVRGDSQMVPTQVLQRTVVVSPSAAPLLHITTPDGSRDFTLNKGPYTLGRNPDNEIVIESPAVSRHHARLDERDGSFEITDLGSTNGLWFNGAQIKKKLLAAGDKIRISDVVFLEFRLPASPAAPSNTAPIELTALSAVSRDAAAGGRFVTPAQLSRLNARIHNEAGRWVLEDAGSLSGTFVNGVRVERQPLSEGDAIQLDGQSLRLIGSRLEVTDADAFTLEAVGLKRVVSSGATILRDISFSVQSREFIAIVGATGSGKSTLISALCGFQAPTAGSVLIDGADLYSQFEAFRGDVGFVPQDDIIHKELSVQRALDYACRLRMPNATLAAERHQRIGEVMSELDLGATGATGVQQLSGGQRKRVSIGVELLTQPKLIFMDEATSGLDPSTETQLMKLFRRLADNGRIVILVTHATKNVKMCDKVLFLARGGYLAYFGPPEDALPYFGAQDFDDIYSRLDEESGEVWAARFRAFAQQSGHMASPAAPVARNNGATAGQTKPEAGRSEHSQLRQFKTLTARNVETLFRSPKDVAVLLLLAPFLGLVNFLIWNHNLLDPTVGNANRAISMFFMLTIVTLLIGSLGTVREIVKEQAIYRREHMTCVRILPYVMSKVSLGFVFAFYSALVLFLCINVAVNFSSLSLQERALLFLPVLLGTMSGVLWGLVVSAISATEERAMLLIIGVIIPQFLLAGGILPIKRMGGIGPLISSLAAAKWAAGAMITIAKIKTGTCAAPDLHDCHMPGLQGLNSPESKQALLHSVTTSYGSIFDVNIPVYLGALVVLLAVLLMLVILIQKRKDTA